MNEAGRWRTGLLLGAAVAGAALLGSCGKKEEAASTEAFDDSDSFFGGAPRPRYAGVGITSPGEGWTKLKAASPQAPDQARRTDDEHIIVVVDNRTGEIRQCGDLSGFCLGMNPWNRKPDAEAPLSLERPEAKSAKQDAAATGHD